MTTQSHPQTFKEGIEKILSNHCFVDSEYKDVFEAMSEVLEKIADRIEEQSPHARETIEHYREVARAIYDMDEVIENNS